MYLLTALACLEDLLTFSSVWVLQKVISYVSKGAVATLFVMGPYILWPF